jgi:hypothetical protein
MFQEEGNFSQTNGNPPEKRFHRVDGRFLGWLAVFSG